MAKKNWKNDDEDGASYDDIKGATRQTRKIKYFINFENKSIQPGNIERIEQDETANTESLGGEDDCLVFNLILYMRDYPFVITFPFATEEMRADALVLLQSQMVDNRIQIQ